MKDGQTIGQWLKWDFKTNGDLKINNKTGETIYWEDFSGWWGRWEYDSNVELIYFEDSKGINIDNRPKPSRELTLESLAEDVLKLSELLTRFVNQVNESNTIK